MKLIQKAKQYSHQIENIPQIEIVKTNGSFVDKRNQLNDLTSTEWIQETKSFFFQKGRGASSPETKFERMHPAPFSFTDVAKLIRFFTKNGEKVLDPFLGVGSTIKACVELNREGFGVELSTKWLKLTKQRLIKESNFKLDKKHIFCEDSRNINDLFSNNFFDFIITSPPYWNILDKKDHKAKKRELKGEETKYSNDKKDLGNINDYTVFLDELSNIFFKCYDLLKPNKYICIIVSDFRHKSEFYSFHSDLIYKLTDKKLHNRFHLKGIKVIIQNSKNLFPYGYPFSYVENIHHQYVLILQKPKDEKIK